MTKVIADSQIWKEYLEKGKSKEAKILEKLIKEDKIVIFGYTLTKILRSIKDKEDFEKVLKSLLVLPFVEIEKKDWIKATKLIFEKKGLNIEVGLLLALSERKNLNLLIKNKEIKKIKGIKLYEDEKE